MIVEKFSDLTGVKHTRDIDVTLPQLSAWGNGELIQDVMPHLSEDDREFLMSGTTAEEFEAAFGAL